MKDKLERTNKRKGYYLRKKILIISLCVLSVGAVTVPASISIFNKINVSGQTR